MKRSFRKDLKRNRAYLLMLLPAVTFFLLFSYFPMAGVIVAFKTFNYQGGIFNSPWAGLDNFKFLFLSDTLFEVTRNTVLYNLTFLVVNNFFQILCAIVIVEASNRLIRKAVQNIVFLPYFVSWVVVGAVVYNLFHYEHGFVNSLLTSMGAQPVDVNDKAWVWALSIVGFSLWKNLGYGTVLYLAAISSIDVQMYEAGKIDGVNMFQRIAYLTIPSLRPTIVTLVLLSVGQIFRGDFSMFYQIVGNNSLVYDYTDVIDTFVTRSLLQSKDFGMTGAAGLFQSVLCFAIIMVVNFLVRKYDPDYALF